MWERIALQLPSAYAPVRTPEMGSYYTPIKPLLSEIVQKGQSSDIEMEASYLCELGSPPTIMCKKRGRLSVEILKKIESEGLDVKNCRGQSYDNGENMAGKYQGVQHIFQKVTLFAKFVPCAAHTLNLVGVMAGYFGTVNCLYIYFSASTNRWEVLLKYSPLALKKESDTRCSSRREAVTVVHKHWDKILEALNHLSLDAVSSRETRKRKKKRFFDEKCENESSEISQHKKFKLALLQVNVRIEAELERRFQSMQKVNEIFGILVSKQLMTIDNKILRAKATTLTNLYRDDLDKDELSVEIESFKYSVDYFY
ncbi:hypothetical protein AVEN_64474-1 [Araneus ventricosus]|uniref:DUF4371 domain-containing protein n=1 Tax=Araneus ventricosus TaxID=182803 RepID=A0A4Y2QY03_ARAVE|nr:hypothetical protein AVEN_64474-1 [Araneus ventricosus]